MSFIAMVVLGKASSYRNQTSCYCSSFYTLLKRLYFCYLLPYLLALVIFNCPTSTSTSATANQSQANSLGVYIVRSPESIVAPLGDEAVFECELNLVPERLKWRFRPIGLEDATVSFKYLEDDDQDKPNKDNKSKLKIYVSPENVGDYQCVAWFGASAVASVTARLTLASIRLGSSAEHSRSISRWTVAPRNSVLIRCGTIMSNPPAVWNFYKNNRLVPQPETKLVSGGLVLNSVTHDDSGIYSCAAINAITSKEVHLPNKIDLRVENMERSAPQLLVEPLAIVSVRPGQSVILECAGVGNPPPKPVWSRPDVHKNQTVQQQEEQNKRTVTLPYGLQILNVTHEDNGTYICRLDNGINPPLVCVVRLQVLEKPIIIEGPKATLTNEDDHLQLECMAKGNPKPEIYWLINGEDTRLDNETYHPEGQLIIEHVQKRHAGIVQCVARNDAGEASESNLLQVNPRQIPGEMELQPLGIVPTKTNFERPGKQSRRRNKHKSNMIPPSQPNVTRLSDDSVMLRWYVPKNDGLPIQFFKVQYRQLEDKERNVKREPWQTTNDDILYGKRDRNPSGMKNFTTSVSGLKPDRRYKFRIIAVYSNNDNKEGTGSESFHLQMGSTLGPSRSHLPAPLLTQVEAISETAIILHWKLPSNRSSIVDGFYAYYRPASTAGEYFKETVDGFNVKKFKIDNLEPGTSYEFKLQSFTESAASDFSSIITGKTLKPPTPPAITPSVVPANKANQDHNSIYPVIVGAAGGGILLLLAILSACFCIKRRKSSQQEIEKPQQIQHNQADYVAPTIGSHHHKVPPSHRMNGVVPRMNITPNPLAQDGDKAINSIQPTYHQTPQPQSPQMKHNQMQQPSSKHHQSKNHHQNNNNQQHHSILQQHGYSYNQAPITPTLEAHRRTLERSARNLHYPLTGALDNCAVIDSAIYDSAISQQTTRIPSLRRTRRTSGNTNNNNGGVGIPIVVPGSPRAQRSPMPVRSIIKRTRTGSHTDNISSGSLNSIEV